MTARVDHDRPLVEVRDLGDGPDLANGVVISPWVVSGLLGESEERDTTPIGPDTRLEFHEYLRDLDDSDRFFNDLSE